MTLVSHLLSYSMTERPGVIFVLAAAVTFYLSGKFAADALTVGGRSPTTIRIGALVSERFGEPLSVTVSVAMTVRLAPV